ncbi:MAG: methyltransferase [Nanoarchaeota archaeon]|nr:methyltransferase [Nanoarchaeota archaeon]
MVYLPREDSYLLKKWVEKLAKGDVLDMGTGTGIQAFAAAPKAKKVIAVDANPEAIEYCKNAVHVFKNIEFRVSDLFSNVPEKFDVIIFNPPYLPESKFDKEIDVTGGKEGWETIERFLKEAKKHLNKNGKILMVFSSLTNPKRVLEIAEKLGYSHNLLEKKHIGFEDLFVYEFFLK